MKKADNFDLRKFITEKLLNENKYQLIFHDDYAEIPVKQLFNTESEAENWANDNKSYSDNYNETYYFNPEDGEDFYTSYEIRQIN